MGKAASGNGNIRKRPNGTWEGRFSAGYNPATGKLVRKSVYGKTQKEVREKLRAAVAALDDGTYFEPTKITVEDWFARWLNEFTVGLHPLTLVSYQNQVRLYIKPRLGKMKLANLDTLTIQKFYNSLLKGSELQKPLSPKSVKNIHGVMHKALAKAVMLGFIKSNPSDSCELPKTKRATLYPLKDNSLTAFLVAVKGHRFERYYLIDIYTGMRESELLALQWRDIDFEAGTITVERQLLRSYIKGQSSDFAPLKNENARRIMPARKVFDLLQQQKAQQTEWQREAGPLWDNPNGLVFTNERGKHLSQSGVYKPFKELVAEIGSPQTRLHDLRHTYATLALQNGDSVKNVQETLGHATATFTLDVYAHVSEAMQKDGADRMQTLIDRLEKEIQKKK